MPVSPVIPCTFGGALDFHQYIVFPPPGDEEAAPPAGYFKIDTGGQIELVGKWAPKDATVGATAGWDQGVAVTISTELKKGNWKLEPKLKFQTPVSVTGDNASAQATWLQISGGAEGSYNANCGLSIALEILLVGVKLSKATTPGSSWEHEVGSLDCTLSGGWSGDLNTDSGKFSGQIKVNGKLGVAPNWTQILEDAVEQYGEDLGVDALAAVAIPLALVLGGVATIVVACVQIYKGWQLEDTANGLDATEAGALAGYLNGLGQSRAQTGDATAYQNGVTSGQNQKATLIAQNCGGDAGKFAAWLTSNASQVESGFHTRYRQGARKQAWESHAQGLIGQLDDLQKWWMVTMGDSPASSGAMAEWTPYRGPQPGTGTFSYKAGNEYWGGSW